MKKFSAQYCITGTGSVLKRPVITTDDEGFITEITDTRGDLAESSLTEFHNGIIIPGMVNCHTHLELSSLRAKVPESTGLGRFIMEIRKQRPETSEESIRHASQTDRLMYMQGVSACGDICNSDLTFTLKDESPIDYINFLEIFGIDPSRADKRLEEIINLRKLAAEHKSPYYISPHSFYSLSSTLFRLLKTLIKSNDIFSVHFLESQQERDLLDSLSGELTESYMDMGINRNTLSDRVPGHLAGIQEFIPETGNLILVHNTFATSAEIAEISNRGNVYFCLCPASNMYIEGRLADIDLLLQSGVPLTIGTDSLASNNELSMIEEMKIISRAYPAISLSDLVEWTCINGARALKMDDRLGTIECGKKPGLVLLKNLDIENLKLRDDSRSERLI